MHAFSEVFIFIVTLQIYISIMDPSDLIGEEGAEEMDIEETAVAVPVPAVGSEVGRPRALENLVAGVFEKVAVGVVTAAVQSEVKEWLVRIIFIFLLY